VIKLILIGILVFLLIRMIVQGVFSYYSGLHEDNSDNFRKRSKEGDVTIESKPKLEKKISKDDGHYVDYEEVK